jgi:VanZ family protein
VHIPALFRTRSRRLLLYAVVGFIVGASLAPLPAWEGARQHFFALVPEASHQGRLDFEENVLLYLPLGVALMAQRIPLARAVAIAAGLSLCLELSQFFVPGRDPSLSDVLANSIGAASGAALFGWLQRRGSR